MRIETFKWLYQRVSTPCILILSFWLAYNAWQIKDYNYETINVFFKNNFNLFFFITFIILSLLHTAIEVFHAIHDYFSETKSENIIKYLTKILYIMVFISIIIFIIRFILL